MAGRKTSPRPPREALPARGTAPGSAPRPGPVWLVAAGVALVVLATFLPTLRNDFVDWDDPHTIQNNIHIRGLDADRVHWMFTTFYWGHYQPLLWLSFALDFAWCSAWLKNGLAPAGYHLTSAILHALNAALVYLVALRLLASARPDAAGARALHAAAALAALLFGLHPLRVEPVAWVTGRGDVLVATFLMLAVIAYLRAGASHTARGYLGGLTLACAAYALSLLSRAMGVTLPLVLLVMDWYPLRRLGGGRGRWFGPAVRHVWLEKLPFLILALGASVLAPLAKAGAGATADFARHDLLQRAAQAAFGLVFYVWKTLVPLALSPIYELHLPLRVWQPRYVVPAILVLVAIAALVALRTRAPHVTVAAACYALLLAPVLGFVQSGNQEAADRYCYVPSVPLMILVGGGGLHAWRSRRAPRWLPPAAAVAGGAAAIALALLSARQCGVWRSTATLWAHAARVAPSSSIAQNGYGWVLLQEKQYDAALARLRRAIELQPANEKAHRNVWIALREQGRLDDLLAAYRESVRVFPNFADGWYQLGRELHGRGDYSGAIDAYQSAIRWRPTHAPAHTNLAKLLAHRGDNAASLAHYELAVRADPQNVAARRGLARGLKRLGRDREALEQLQAALRIAPQDEEAKALLRDWAADPSATAPSRD